MKKALILCGNFRTFDQCLVNFNSTFSDEVDIFISTYDIRYGYHSFINNKFGYDDDDDEYLSDINIKKHLESINYKYLTIEKIDDIDRYVAGEKIKFSNGMKDIDSCFFQYSKIRRIMNEVIKYENENGFKYEIIMKSRFDIIYNPIDFNINNNNMVVDMGNSFPNDVFFMCKRNGFINTINFMVSEFYNKKVESSDQSPPHQLLYNGIIDSGLGLEQRNIVKQLIRR